MKAKAAIVVVGTFATACAGVDMAPYVARMKAVGWSDELINIHLCEVETGESDIERLEQSLEFREADMEGWPALMRLLGVEDEEDAKVFPQVRSIPVLEAGMEFRGGTLRIVPSGTEDDYLGRLCYTEGDDLNNRAFGDVWIAENPASARRLLFRKMTDGASAPIMVQAQSLTVSREGPGDFCVLGGAVDRQTETIVPDKNVWFTAGPYVASLRANSEYLNTDVTGLGRALAGVLKNVANVDNGGDGTGNSGQKSANPRLDGAN